MIICLTGMPGSGKSTAAKIFEKAGFEVFEGSATIKEEMEKLEIAITSESIETFANRMKDENGKAYFAAITGKKVAAAAKNHNILVIGFRSTAEFDELKQVIGSEIPLIVITSPESIRFKRLSERKTIAIKSKEAFLTRDKGNIGQGIDKLIENADYIISNTGSEKELEESILELLKALGD